MSDFLIQLDRSASPADLLGLLKQPYAANPPEGSACQYPWGTLAVLRERIGFRTNVVAHGPWTFAWAGELIGPDRLALDAILAALQSASLAPTPSEVLRWLSDSGLLKALNGAFAAVLCSERVLVALTDPMGSVQLYAGRDPAGRLVALGTHADLVAALASEGLEIDPVSVCDFLNLGTPCCPHTMHRTVREVWPGTAMVSCFEDGQPPAYGECRYWLPPGETGQEGDTPNLIHEFGRRWERAISSRCDGRVGVQLSGGMDSRLVLAAIPKSSECCALTLCDSMNREARFARSVAECYRRQWIPLRRDPEYLGRTLLESTRFTGCEGEYHHGHTIGFARRLQELGIDSVFTGLLMDNNFKAYYARDIVRVPQAKGLLPARYSTVKLDYVNQVSGFCRQHIRDECVAATIERRQHFYEGHFARGRQSQWEWLDGYPYSQACDNTGWVIERRVLPLRLPVMDRNLLDLAFRIPASFKAGGRFFEQAALPLLGPGRRIANANDGVRPGSGHVARLIQRARRKAERRGRALIAGLGLDLGVPHSWHDFPRYLRESNVLADLIGKEGARLREFEGAVFKTDPTQLLRDPSVPWQVQYRLIQLAAWQSILAQYHAPQRAHSSVLC